MLRRHPRLALSILSIALSGACLERTAHYGPARDDAAMAAIASTFVEAGAGGVVLSVCEDVAASEGWVPECRYQHVVQGGGRGREHEEDVGGLGCGGCPFKVVAYVQGTVEGGPFAQPTTLRGTVTLQSGHDRDPYAFPYRVELDCDGAEPCRLAGDLDATGALQLEVTAGTPVATSPHLVERQAAAACP